MLVEKGYDNKMGARPLNRKIDELIRVPLSKKILFERLSDCVITADMVDDKINFIIITNPALATIDNSGIILLDGESPTF
jgi:ATP-dependent Clp protease ATP-binding subunit ClpA